MEDKNGVEIKNGIIINIHQTVNGYSIFVVLDVDNLDIRYGYDLSRKYEYDRKELLDCHEPFTKDKTVEVIGNIHEYINSLTS